MKTHHKTIWNWKEKDYSKHQQISFQDTIYEWSVIVGISFEAILMQIININTGPGNFPQASIVQLQQILVCMNALFSCYIRWNFPVLRTHMEG